MRRRLVSVLFLIAFTAPALLGQTAAPFAQVATALQPFVDKGEVAGVVTLIADKERIVHLGAVGKSSLSDQRVMRTDDLFWIASMTKPIVAACVAILVDAGKLTFDDPLAKHLPEFAGLNVRVGDTLATPSRAITLRDVLTHTSGLGEMTSRPPHLTLAETSVRLAREPLRFQPGTRWGYSTAGIDVLGRVVEVVSGTPFDRFLQQRILDPLGMKDTSFWVADAKLPRLARSYQWVANENRLRETTISYLYGTEVGDRARPPLGGAGLFSTATDVARFYQMMLNKGTLRGRRVLSAAVVAEMITKQTGDLQARAGMPWGLGVSIVEDPTAMEANKPLAPSSFGHGGAYSTQSWADPVNGLVWVVMFQRNGKGNGDNSDIRIAFQEAAAAGLQQYRSSKR